MLMEGGEVVGGQSVFFDLHFLCLLCIFFAMYSGKKLLMRQAGHSQKRMHAMRLKHSQRHILLFFLLFPYS